MTARRLMRAFVLTGPGKSEVQEVPVPVATPGEVVVDVERVGVCGTDMEFHTGAMAYLHQGHSAYPMRLGHEWSGRVAAVGGGVDPGWTGRRVMGDTMLGCGSCRRCLRGHQHVCEKRQEVGIRGERAGALAEQLAVPVSSLHVLPDSVDAVLGALVEPGGNALRAARAAELRPGDRVLVLGPGTIGLLVAMFARAAGAEVHLMGTTDGSLAFARDLGFEHAWREDTLPDLPYDAVVDASNAAHLPDLGAGVGRTGRPCRLHRSGRRTQPDRHPHPRPQGRHRRRCAVRLARSRRHHPGVRRGFGRPETARRRDGRAGRGRSRPRGWTPGGRGSWAEVPCGPAPGLRRFRVC